MVLLGTSGWTYDHWKGIFYPDSVPKKRWFEYFSTVFDTVELNASFYRIPTIKAVQGWEGRSPEYFRFAVKMSRLITHVRRLKNCERELEWFFSVFEPLQHKIAAFLVQLPPSMKIDIGRLDEFIRKLPQKSKFAFEFRNTTWYNPETYALLKEHGQIFCIHDMSGLATERIVTSDTIYIRFHGYASVYGGDYHEELLRDWAAWIREQIRDGKSVYGYFNNDIGGFAVKNCLRLRESLGSSQFTSR